MAELEIMRQKKPKPLPTVAGERIGLTVKLREGQYGIYQAVYYSAEAQ